MGERKRWAELPTRHPRPTEKVRKTSEKKIRNEVLDGKQKLTLCLYNGTSHTNGEDVRWR